jgi:hypothetical protein
MNSEVHKNREALKCVSEILDYLCTVEYINITLK